MRDHCHTHKSDGELLMNFATHCIFQYDRISIGYNFQRTLNQLFQRRKFYCFVT